MSFRDFVAIIGFRSNADKPVFHKRSECDICHKITPELHDFNNLKLCTECFSQQKKRFPLVK